jgi:hypothetical protein
VSQYVPGDFVIHFAGKKGRKKLHLLEHYLSIAETQYKSEIGILYNGDGKGRGGGQRKHTI